MTKIEISKGKHGLYSLFGPFYSLFLLSILLFSGEDSSK